MSDSAGDDVTVLVVDDDEDQRHSLAMLLEDDGYSVRTVDSAEAALADAKVEPPVCVILDLTMPGMDGIQLARELRTAHGEDIVLIMLTGLSGTLHGHAGAEAAGLDYVLQKPLDVERLRKMMPRVAMR